MTLAEISIRRPIFITCIVILSLAVGYLSLTKLPVDLFPNVTFPVVTVTTVYPGAGPEEIETLVSRPLEEEFSSLGGMKRLKSINKEGVSTVIAEFTLETDVKYAEQQIRDRTSSVKRKLPTEAKEPIIRRIDPADQPVVMLAMSSELSEGQAFELADKVVRPKMEQVNQVGLVEVLGGRKREIQVQLDAKKLKDREISITQVATRLGVAGKNVPAGKVEEKGTESIVRTLGEFRNLDDIRNSIVNFVGNDVPVTVSDIGLVKDTLEDETSRATLNGRPAILLMIFRQSGANTIAVSDAIKLKMNKLNEELANLPGRPSLMIARDGAKPIRFNVADVKESIFMGIVLTIIVVFFFLGSFRSTVITGLALPNSLLGAFILMSVAGFSINLMTLLALSLAVGLLIDDAIVVRENIFRHIEMGKSPKVAALEGTKEVTLAVLATTLTVIAVFGPIAFLQGVVGQFFKEFGLTVCFALMISLFDALTIAPMLSAYYASSAHGVESKNLVAKFFNFFLKGFGKFQDQLDVLYEKILKFSLRRPIAILVGAVVIFIFSLGITKWVPKTFLPPQDNGEFGVDLDMPPGTSLDKMSQVAHQIDAQIRKNPEVTQVTITVGSRDGSANKAQAFIQLVDSKLRKENTSQFKDKIREQLKPYAFANPKVKDIDYVGGGQRPFNLNIVGPDLEMLEKYGQMAFEKLKANDALKDPDISYRPGKPEWQVRIDTHKAEQLGVSSVLLGQEVRSQLEGVVPAVYREKGEEYDVRVRLQEDQRNLSQTFKTARVPNINGSLIRLDSVAELVKTTGLSNIDRQDRGRFIQISADITPGGRGIGGAMNDVNQMFANEIKLPEGMRFSFEGQAENFKELQSSMVTAAGLGILFIYLVLASLYESFIIPFTIMLVLPLAACGAFIALLITRESLDLFSMIGCIMLLGVATKNSILLVDYANQQLALGKNRYDAMLAAGRTRLRPILMTSFALIAGMIPLAMGLNEASKQRKSLGIAVIGGIVSSTLLTLVVVPAAFSYIDRFRLWLRGFFSRLQPQDKTGAEHG